MVIHVHDMMTVSSVKTVKLTKEIANIKTTAEVCGSASKIIIRGKG